MNISVKDYPNTQTIVLFEVVEEDEQGFVDDDYFSAVITYEEAKRLIEELKNIVEIPEDVE